MPADTPVLLLARLLAERDELLAKLAETERRLAHYGTHKDDCGWWHGAVGGADSGCVGL